MTSQYALLLIVLSAICTIAVRTLPFTLLGGDRPVPRKLEYLGKILPPAIMAVLVIYCLKDVPFAFLQTGIPKLIGVAVVVVTYLWKHNTFISIISGTAVYMLLLSFM